MMTFPDDLPWMVEWRMNGPGERPCVLSSLPRRPVTAQGTSGKTDACIVRPQFPAGANAWRLPGREWQSLAAIPKHWMPFLDRKRESALDFRPKNEELPRVAMEPS